MIHITKTKSKEYMIVVTGNNGEVLSTSEPLKSKAAAWNNILAQFDNFLPIADVLVDPEILVQDDTLKNQTVYNLEISGTSFKNGSVKFIERYTPSKNKKSSK